MRNDPKLLELARKLGRVSLIAQQAQREKMEYVSGETAEIELGRDLSRVLPSELVKLLSPALKKDWQRRYVEGALMQYHLVDREPVGRGPIVCCVDESGSMGGDPLLWAKLAYQQKRAFAYIPFSTTYESLEYPHGADQVAIMKIATHNYGAGTVFEPPLQRAVQIVERSEFEKADIVFLTDGDGDVDHVTAQWFARVKAEKKFRAIGILIGRNAKWGYYGREAGTVAALWDGSFRVDFRGDAAKLTKDDHKALSVVFST